MATVAERAPSAQPVRHGKCRLSLVINEQVYTLRRGNPSTRGMRQWLLRKSPDTVYCVTRYHGVIECSCPDASFRGSQCKHARALVALGLLSGRSPSAKGGA